jgi:tRNA(Ile)-lysidine synthase
MPEAPPGHSQLDHSQLDRQLAGALDARHWYVGFSGGLDSTVLLHLIHHWRKAHRDAPPVTAIHVNHALQALADDWQQHCQWICKVLQLPIICVAADVQPDSGGLEAAAREARYQVFEGQLQGADVLFLGHHLDDQVETFFLRLLRGAGVHGLGGMPAARPLGSGRLLRPLLDIPRTRLQDYAARHQLRYVEDPTNHDTDMDRNFLRARLLPLLASRWPGYRQTVSRASEHIAAASTVLEMALPAPVTVRSVMGDPGIALAELLGAGPGEAALKLRHWLHAGGYLAPDQAMLAEFLRQLRDSAGQANPRLECSAYTLQRFRDAVFLLEEPPGSATCEPFQLAPGEVYALPGAGRLGLEASSAQGLQLDADERLQVQWRQGGERCKPRGRAGSTSLKKLLQEYHVPPWWRDRVPLLYLDAELLAVGDLWLCESSRWREAPGRGELLWQPRWQRNKPSAFD